MISETILSVALAFQLASPLDDYVKAKEKDKQYRNIYCQYL